MLRDDPSVLALPTRSGTVITSLFQPDSRHYDRDRDSAHGRSRWLETTMAQIFQSSHIAFWHTFVGSHLVPSG